LSANSSLTRRYDVVVTATASASDKVWLARCALRLLRSASFQLDTGFHCCSLVSPLFFLVRYIQIMECAVVGVPDDILGERVLAVVALRTTSTTSTASSASGDTSATAVAGVPAGDDLHSLRGDSKEVLRVLRAFLHDKLAQYKQPREYVIVEAIPRNHLGKVSSLCVHYSMCVALCGF
jgi:acyl-CoA synthetase (AMP-forming)/AMP-acid ligase II